MLCSQNKCLTGYALHYFARCWCNLSTFHVVVQTTALRKEIYLCGRLGGVRICARVYVLSSKYVYMQICGTQYDVTQKGGLHQERNTTGIEEHFTSCAEAYSLYIWYKIRNSMSL